MADSSNSWFSSREHVGEPDTRNKAPQMTEQEQIEEQAWAELIKLFAAQTPLERMVLEAKGEM